MTTDARTISFGRRIGLCAVLAGALGVAWMAPAGFGQDQGQTSRSTEPTGYRPKSKSRESERGRQLFARLKCSDCHVVAGSGGVAGPPLDGVGGRRNEWFLARQISDPERLTAEHPDLKAWEPCFMPDQHVSARDVRALVAYLMTLPEPSGGYVVGRHLPRAVPDAAPPAGGFTPLADSELSARGRKLYFDSGCASCHAIGHYGGSFGPRLDGVGARHSRAYVEAYISSPQLIARSRRDAGRVPSVMPPIDLKPDEIEAIGAFLMTLADRGGQ